MRESLQPFQTVRDVLHKLRELHESCQRRFARRADSASTGGDHRLQALLSFVATREQEQQQALARFDAQEDTRLASYVQSVPADLVEEVKRTGSPDGDFDTVRADAEARDRAFVQLYEQLADNVGPNAGGIFHDLAEQHRRNQGRLHEALLDY